MKEIKIERLNGNKGSKPENNAEQHLENDKIAPNKKKFKRRIGEKTYTITVTHVEVSEEQWKIKRSTIESILKKAWL
ncbi:hypothetical protein [Pedobacter sp. UYP1]|uniref:hypothetical protein n=1 Tax=Pedobacter sp. UYP1 TaxID=1756396 RepID=UPI003392C1B9